MPRNSIYLSGWEYNRLRNDDPTAPTVSGLPAEALWNGAAQFWLFEKVYCTQESLDGDIAAAEELGWTTGRIFQDLKARGFLEAVSWRDVAAKSPLVLDELREIHGEMRQHYSESALLELLQHGYADELESIKLRLMQPILRHLGCAQNISPNSIRQWYESDKREDMTKPSLGMMLHHSMMRARLGFKLCNTPGTGVSVSDRNRQRDVEETVQKPMIPALLAGILPQREYHHQLQETADVYRPINEQLARDYREGIVRLERLRTLAKQYVWPMLHNDWLYRLEEEPEFFPRFAKQIVDACRAARFDPLLENVTDWTIIGVSTGMGMGAAAIALAAGADPVLSAGVGAATGSMLKRTLDGAHARRREALKPLSLFFQALQPKRRSRK